MFVKCFNKTTGKFVIFIDSFEPMTLYLSDDCSPICATGLKNRSGFSNEMLSP